MLGGCSLARWNGAGPLFPSKASRGRRWSKLCGIGVRRRYLADSAGMVAGTRTAAIAILGVDNEAQDRFNEVKGHYETLSN